MRPFPEGAGLVEVLQKLGGCDFYSDKIVQKLDGINGIPLATSNKRRTIQDSFFLGSEFNMSDQIMKAVV